MVHLIIIVPFEPVIFTILFDFYEGKILMIPTTQNKCDRSLQGTRIFFGLNSHQHNFGGAWVKYLFETIQTFKIYKINNLIYF